MAFGGADQRKIAADFVRLRIYHPWLITAYPVLSLYARNQYELPVGQVFLPLGLSWTGTFLLGVFLRRFFCDAHKAAIGLSLFLILFFSYGHLHEILNVFVLPQHFLSRHRFLMPLFFLLPYFVLNLLTPTTLLL